MPSYIVQYVGRRGVQVRVGATLWHGTVTRVAFVDFTLIFTDSYVACAHSFWRSLQMPRVAPPFSAFHCADRRCNHVGSG